MRIKAKFDGIGISKGKIYQAIEHYEEYFVKDDSGERYPYPKEYFDVIEE